MLVFIRACLLDWHPQRLCWGGYFSKSSDKDFNAYLCPFASVSSGTEDAEFYSARIKYCAAWMIAPVDYIFGMLNCLGENSTVSEICYALVLEMYTLWNM